MLKALEYLDSDKQIDQNDIREALPEEEEVKTSRIRFIFNFTTEERFKFVELLASKFAGIEAANDLIFVTRASGKAITLVDFVSTNKDIVYVVDLMLKTKFMKTWNIDDKYEFKAVVQRVASQDVQVKTRKTGVDCDVQKGDYAIKQNVEVVEGLLTAAEFSEFVQHFYSECKQYASSLLPPVVFWRYDDKYILPARVSLDKFIADENICLPLKHLLLVGGCTNPSIELKGMLEKQGNVLMNRLNCFSTRATEYFKEIWPEYGVKFSLTENAGNLIPTVQDVHNRFSVSQRSDGFKRFVAILLMISVRRTVESLSGALILMDEPDVSLHPSAVRFLRDELLRVARNNVVVISTHSIFMIDQSCVQRHVIVKKMNEVTVLSVANNSNFADEEVLYNALGYSVFSVLKDTNFVFEGWRDKHLFLTAIGKIPSKFKRQLMPLKNIGACHSNGVKGFSQIASMLELANRKFLLISDADKPARENKQRYEDARYPGVWYMYSDLSSDAITAEDFIDSEYLLKCAADSLVGISLNGLVFPPYGKLFHLSTFMQKAGCKKEEINTLLDNYKSKIFEDLTSSHITKDYYELLSVVADMVGD